MKKDTFPAPVDGGSYIKNADGTYTRTEAATAPPEWKTDREKRLAAEASAKAAGDDAARPAAEPVNHEPAAAPRRKGA